MAIRTWVGRFCVAEGRVQEEGPWLGSLIRQRPDEEADELYVLVEPAHGPAATSTRRSSSTSSPSSTRRTPCR